MAEGFEIAKIELTNFRNYTDFTRQFESGLNKIVGPNATGKSNLLEAIALLTQIGSFRHSQIVDLINNNSDQDFAIVEAQIIDHDLDSLINFMLTITENKKIYNLNGKNKKIIDCKLRFPSVVFTPDDLMIVKGSNTLRRDAIDHIGCQISKEYNVVLRDFKKALRQKNTLLTETVDVNLIKSINDVMLNSATQLTFFRAALVKKINAVLQDFHNQITSNNEDLEIQYFASWDLQSQSACSNKNEIRTSLELLYNKNLNDEVLAKKCLVGPQKDVINFVLNGQDSKKFASQGQQRSIVLALKLAELNLIESTLNKKPILLLDDVLSELDQTRQTQFLQLVQDLPQTFITSTS